MKPDQQPAAVPADDRQVAGMDVQTWKIASQVGQRHKTGKDGKINRVAGNPAPQFPGPAFPDLPAAFRRQRSAFQAVPPIEFPDIQRRQRQFEPFGQLGGTAFLRSVGHQQNDVETAGRTGGTELQQFLGIGPAPAQKYGNPGRTIQRQKLSDHA